MNLTYDDENDWDLVNGLADESFDSIVMVDYDEDDENETSSDLSSNKASYKDILLRPNSTVKSLDIIHHPPLTSKTKWQPKFVTISVPFIRADRIYGSQSASMITDIEDDDEDLEMDPQTFLKLSTAITKKRTISMLPPKIQAKKNQRIMQKLIQRG